MHVIKYISHKIISHALIRYIFDPHLLTFSKIQLEFTFKIIRSNFIVEEIISNLSAQPPQKPRHDNPDSDTQYLDERCASQPWVSPRGFSCRNLNDRFQNTTSRY